MYTICLDVQLINNKSIIPLKILYVIIYISKYMLVSNFKLQSTPCGKNYYTVDQSKIMYCAEYPVSEVIRNNSIRCGPLHCNTCNHEKLYDIIVGTCNECIIKSKSNWRCTCTDNLGFKKAILSNSICKDNCIISFYQNNLVEKNTENILKIRCPSDDYYDEMPSSGERLKRC